MEALLDAVRAVQEQGAPGVGEQVDLHGAQPLPDGVEGLGVDGGAEHRLGGQRPDFCDVPLGAEGDVGVVEAGGERSIVTPCG
ncbi:hypothetical protein ABZV75_34245 [Streptomyces flaveolus]|uniref:hypothetical protein n=1 Tax=Streptomyces flaveolus TaxID=67297 RepID=UPI0033A6C4F2